jgi:translation initiation factor 2B subunit (eIF-2B alpha/beta/delta family)/8-oxo-dGTP pyrophosphatase MutT (NUDIX family)
MILTSPRIHRVVTTFIVRRPNSIIDTTGGVLPPKVAIFHRCDTMPTFPSYWAGISGTIEDGETPHQAAQRELLEETNITETVTDQGGLYLDVLYQDPKRQQERTIRVYPFVVTIGDETSIELRGTEHDRYQMVTVDELEAMESVCVPGLVQAFHHATYGSYDQSIASEVREWARDKENGASVMTSNALQLLHKSADHDWKTKARHIAMLRPSMVPITNAMQHVLENGRESVTMASLQQSIIQSVALGIQAIEELENNKSNKKMTIGTFSRSGTLRLLLSPFLERHTIVCGKSSPGNEGELMAQDLDGSTCMDDEELRAWLANGKIDLLVVGSDCILPQMDAMVNKVGTRELCRIATENHVPVFCCADRWKIWNDKFAPPLEADLFELVPLQWITTMLIAPN